MPFIHPTAHLDGPCPDTQFGLKQHGPGTYHSCTEGLDLAAKSFHDVDTSLRPVPGLAMEPPPTPTLTEVVQYLVNMYNKPPMPAPIQFAPVKPIKAPEFDGYVPDDLTNRVKRGRFSDDF